MSIDMPDEVLARMWAEIDWEAAEEKLAGLQQQLTLAAYRKNDEKIKELQKRIVRDADIKCLAVRHVTASDYTPGVDRVKWTTPAEKMRAAMSLTSKGYHAAPMKQILITAKNSGKERRPRIPTYYDRAMNVLYGYSLIPVTEATAERKSFAFRPGRSAQDAHAYILEALKGQDAPDYVVCGDIKAYYAHIQHAWLLAHVPMDKRVLSEFLNAGIVFAGELFPAEDIGISEGASISPYLGNFVLDGLQKYIYEGLHGTTAPADYANGNLIRYADDVLVTTRTREDADTVLRLLEAFLDERGLTLSEEKTTVRRVTEGFTFLARTYIRKSGLMYSRPSDKAVNRFIEDLRTTILENKKSQRDMILLLNRKLKGWAGYHRCTDAADAFRAVDAAVQTALLEAAVAKHPKLPLPKLQAKYWYKEADGRHCYALPDDKSVRVVRLADTLLLMHHKVKTNANPFVDRAYMESRTHERAVTNVTGTYRSVWERQGGICYYCGRPILTDQPRVTVPLDISAPPSVKNSVYVHKMCVANEFEIVQALEEDALTRPCDTRRILEQLAAGRSGMSEKKEIPPNWKHKKLKEYFAKATAASITLSFKQIEQIEGHALTASARKYKEWWYPRSTYNKIAEAWLTEGYYMFSLDMEKQKVTLHRVGEGVSKLVIPEVLTSGRLPDNAVYELETHMEYVIKKYGLAKGV